MQKVLKICLSLPSSIVTNDIERQQKSKKREIKKTLLHFIPFKVDFKPKSILVEGYLLTQ
jgi:hypothetical protein